MVLTELYVPKGMTEEQYRRKLERADTEKHFEQIAKESKARHEYFPNEVKDVKSIGFKAFDKESFLEAEGERRIFRGRRIVKDHEIRMASLEYLIYADETNQLFYGNLDKFEKVYFNADIDKEKSNSEILVYSAELCGEPLKLQIPNKYRMLVDLMIRDPEAKVTEAGQLLFTGFSTYLFKKKAIVYRGE
jgi:hypothetical protein